MELHRSGWMDADLDDCIGKHLQGELDVPTAAKAKWRLTEQQNLVRAAAARR
jgi:hypothetical protein